MKKFSFSAVLAGLFLGLPVGADAAYPVYPSRQVNSMPTGVVPNNGQMMYVPAMNYGNVVPATYGAYNNNAAAPTRVTGALPRVGTAQSTAGRQYYQPADYDRLADSGLYVGLSAGFTASVMGDMTADYQGEQNSYFVPGAFQAAEFQSDSVIPLQISVGAAINNDVRVDFSYLRYSGISYPDIVQTSDGMGGYIEAQVDGGAITANTTMLNVYYNIDSYTGYLAGGSLRPYIGAGVGISLNTVADYVVYDGTFYSEMDPTQAGPGDLTGISDVLIVPYGKAG